MDNEYYVLVKCHYMENVPYLSNFHGAESICYTPVMSVHGLVPHTSQNSERKLASETVSGVDLIEARMTKADAKKLIIEIRLESKTR